MEKKGVYVMPISTTATAIFVLAMVLILIVGLFYTVYNVVDTIFWYSLTKRLYCALENSLISYFESKDFDHAMAELELIIQHIIKPNKYFSLTCYSVDGLLRQYIYWLNIGRIHTKTDITKLKSTAHSLIEQYRAKSFTSEALLYKEPLLNEVSKSLAKKDFEGIQKTLVELDTKIAKERKRSKAIYIWLPPAATIVGTVAAAIISSLFK